MDAAVYNQTGKEVGKVSLPENVFGLPWNADLVHQVIVSEYANTRTPVAHTKDRSEVRGGGKKPWAQKGTGRARHGSSRSPIWVGGGVTHGPRNEKIYSKKINRKMKAKALYVVLSEKFRNGEVLFLDSVKFAGFKTKDAKNVVSSLAGLKGFEALTKKKNNAALFALGAKDKTVEKSFSNIENIRVSELRNLTPTDVLGNRLLVISHPEESVKFIAAKIK